MSSRDLHGKAILTAAVIVLLIVASWIFISRRASATVSCGETITNDVTLAQDLNCPEGVGFVVEGNGINVDLAGHTITGPGPGRRSWPVPTFESVGLRILGDNVTVRNGQISGFGTSILVRDARGAKVLSVETSGSYYGLYLFGGGGHAIMNSAVVDNVYGLTLFQSNDNMIRGNQLSRQTHHSPGGYGVYLSESSGNLLEHNTIEDNLNWGLWFSESSNNTIVRNNVINNDPQVSDNSGGNAWFDAERREGNYWSDYRGPDANGDGVGDVPYQIGGPGRAADLYPFINPNGWDQAGRVTRSIATPEPQPPAPPLAFVALNNGQIAIIDLAQQTLVKQLDANTTDGDLALSPDGERVYAISGDEVVTIDVETGEIVESYPIAGAVNLAATYDDKRLIISTEEGGVSIVLESGETQEQPKLENAVAILPSWKHNLALVATPRGTLNVLYMPGHHVPYEMPLEGTPEEVIDNPAGTQIYTVIKGRNKIYLYETEFFQPTGELPLGDIPSESASLALAPDGSRIYILDRSSGHLVSLDMATEEIEASFDLGAPAAGLAVSSEGDRLAVAGEDGNLVILDAQLNEVSQIPLDAQPIGITALR